MKQSVVLGIWIDAAATASTPSDQTLPTFNTATRSMTLNTKALRLSSDEAATLLNALDNVDKPFWGWAEHDSLASRVRDLIIWLDAE